MSENRRENRISWRDQNHDKEDENENLLDISLSLGPTRSPSNTPSLMSDQSHRHHHHLLRLQQPPSVLQPSAASRLEAYDNQIEPGAASGSLVGHTRRNPRVCKSDQVPTPYPWATTKRATVHTLNHLLSNRIHFITGQVRCKRCERLYTIEHNLKEKFLEIARFVAENKGEFRERAPSSWTSPRLPTCRFCGEENSVKPVMSEKKRRINWLFLLLGQMLGCCTLEQLKYFCKHTRNHRTGAKDRVLYLTYLGLCKQLDPSGPFHR